MNLRKIFTIPNAIYLALSLSIILGLTGIRGWLE